MTTSVNKAFIISAVVGLASTISTANAQQWYPGYRPWPAPMMVSQPPMVPAYAPMFQTYAPPVQVSAPMAQTYASPVQPCAPQCPVYAPPVTCDDPPCVIEHEEHKCCVIGSGVILGGEWHFLRPVINDNLAFAATNTSGTVRTTAINSFPYHFESDPSVWAGYRTCCGLGFTATWFHVDNNSDPVVTPITTITIPAPTGTISFNPGDPVTITNDLKMDIFDFDVTKRCELCCNFDFTFGGGVRYVHMLQDYNASFTVPAALGGASVSQIGSDSFNGAGPTLVCDGLWRCGCTGFGLYANGRIGVLFGSKGENSTLSSTARIPGTASTLVLASGNFESTIGFVEVEVGAQWCRRMGPVCPFVRVGFEGREFVGIGNAVQATSGLNNSQVGLFGLGVSAGIGF